MSRRFLVADVRAARPAMRPWCRVRIACTLLAAAPAGACGEEVDGERELHALLVGVADYRVDALEDLLGPVNDVRLIAATLEQRFGANPSNLRQLVTGGPTEPTRRAILDALAALEERVGEGDFAVVYLAGHGVPVPEPEGESDEWDGYDEAFLAADTGPWDDESGRLPGAITDDELGAAIARILAKDTDVWLVADSCHSGTLHRGTERRRTREASRSGLGIPPRAKLGASTGRRREGGAFTDGVLDAALEGGRLVVFCAAQPDQRCHEFRYTDPLGDGAEKATFGAFTYALERVLATGRGIATYDDLILQTAIRLKAADIQHFQPRADGRIDRPIPMLLDRDHRPFVVYTDRVLKLNRGAVDGMHEGATLVATRRGDDGSMRDVRLVVRTVRAVDSFCAPTGTDSTRSLTSLFDEGEAVEVRLDGEPLSRNSVPIWANVDDPAARAELAELETTLWVRAAGSPEESEWWIESNAGGFLLIENAPDGERYWEPAGSVARAFRDVYAVRTLRALVEHPWVGGLPEGLEVSLVAGGERERGRAVTDWTAAQPTEPARIRIDNATPDDWQLEFHVVHPHRGTEALRDDWRRGPVLVEAGARGFEPFGQLAFDDGTLGPHDLLVFATRSRIEGVPWSDRVGLRPYVGDPVRATTSKRSLVPVSDGSPLGDLLAVLIDPKRSTEASGAPSYRDVETRISLIPFGIEWGAPAVGELLGGRTDGSADEARVGCLDDLPLELPELPRAAWEAGDRHAEDVLLLGDGTRRAWLVDPLRSSIALASDGVVRRAPFSPRFAFIDADTGFVGTYDRDGDGRWDLTLLDTDRDLRADRRWERGAAGWSAPTVDGREPVVSLKAHLDEAPGVGRWLRSTATRRLRATLFPATESGGSALLARDRSPVPAARGEVGAWESRARELLDELLSAPPVGEDAPRLPEDVALIVVDAPEVNAWAQPGAGGAGIIRLTTGLIDALDENSAHVRAVIAHELAHLVCAHDPCTFGLRGALAHAADVRHHVSRRVEFEADRVGVSLLERAGFERSDLRDALVVLHRVQRERGVPWMVGIGGDHGSASERIARMQPDDGLLQGLASYERGLALLECRRPDRAIRALERALEHAPDLDEAAFALARARIEVYHEHLPPVVRRDWLRPDLGPLLTRRGFLGGRGATVTPGDRERWRAAMDEIDGLAVHVDPVLHRLFEGTLLALHPDDESRLRRGADVLAGIVRDERLRRTDRHDLRLAAANNLALAQDRLGDVRAAWTTLRAALEGPDGVLVSELLLANAASVAAEATRLDSVARGAGIVEFDAMRRVVATAGVGTPAAVAALEAARRMSEASDVGPLECPEPAMFQVCRPVTVRIADVEVGLLDPRPAELAALGEPALDGHVHPEFPTTRYRAWSRADETDVVALVEGDEILKLTTYRPGSSVTLTERAGGRDRRVVLRVGDPVEELRGALGEVERPQGSRPATRFLGRGRSARLGANERWCYFPDLSLGVLVQEGTVVGLTLCPAGLR